MTKLARWSLYPIRLPYFRSIRWADVVEEAADFMLLELETDAGARGIGELTVKPTWSGVTLRSVAAALEDLFLPKLATLDLADPAALEAAFRSIPENRAAKTLVDLALWDVRANAAAQPLHQLLGGAQRIEVSATLTRAAPATMAREAAELVERHGFRTIKFKGGQGLTTDLAGLSAVRQALGNDVRIYVDANGYYSRDAGIAYVDQLAAAGVFLAEDPYPLAADPDFERVHRDVPIPILVDSAAAGLIETTAFLDRGARAMSVKPGRIGLTAARESAPWSGCPSRGSAPRGAAPSSAPWFRRAGPGGAAAPRRWEPPRPSY